LTQIVHPHAIFFAFSLLGLALGVLTATIDGTNSGWLNHYQKADSRSHHLQKGPKTWIIHHLYYKQQKDSKYNNKHVVGVS
jgi:hypothetical protein